MVQRVIEEGVVSIGTTRFRMVQGSRVRSQLADQYPAKVLLGDSSQDSHGRTSVVTWSDWSGGIGKNRVEGSDGLTRIWDGNLNILIPGMLILPFDSTLINNPSEAGIVSTIIGRVTSGTIFATFSAGDKVYDFGGTNWTSRDTMPADATDVLACYLGNAEDRTLSEWLVWATTEGFTATENGTTFIDNPKNTKYLAYWDNRLWGIDNEGQLWYWLADEDLTTAEGTAYNDAVLPTPAGDIAALFTGPDAFGEEIIYAATKVGLFAHDAANARFLKTALVYARNDNGGKGATTWNGDIYVAVENAVYRYIPRSGIIQSVGLDQDGGLPSAHRTTHIAQLIPAGPRLFARAAQASDGQNRIYEYNGRGWGVLFSVPRQIDAIHVGNEHSAYRMWLSWVLTPGGNALVNYIDLPVENVQPEEDTSIIYEDGITASIETPWFTADQVDIVKLAVRLKLETINPTTSETIKVEFKIDKPGNSYSELGTITTGGVTTYTFPDNGTNPDIGSAFQAIRFQLTLARGGTSTNTPILKSMSLEFRKKTDDKDAFMTDLDLSEEFEGRSPQVQLSLLKTARGANTQQEFTYRDTSGGGATYYVDVTGFSAIETTGYDQRGHVQVRMEQL